MWGGREGGEGSAVGIQAWPTCRTALERNSCSPEPDLPHAEVLIRQPPVAGQGSERCGQGGSGGREGGARQLYQRCCWLVGASLPQVTLWRQQQSGWTLRHAHLMVTDSSSRSIGLQFDQKFKLAVAAVAAAAAPRERVPAAWFSGQRWPLSACQELPRRKFQRGKPANQFSVGRKRHVLLAAPPSPTGGPLLQFPDAQVPRCVPVSQGRAAWVGQEEGGLERRPLGCCHSNDSQGR